MRVYGEFNNISDELKALIVPLHPKQYAKYQLIEKIILNDPNPRPGDDKYRYPHRQIWAKDTIFDFGSKKPVDIGVVAPGGYDASTETVIKVEGFEFSEFRTGIMVLDGSISLHRELHEFLQITNMSRNTLLGDFRDSSVEQLFFLIDEKKESMNKNKAHKAKATAMAYAVNMQVDELREYAASKNWNFEADPEILENMVSDFADKYPDKFMAEIENPDAKKKAIIKYALAKGMIAYDPSLHRMLWPNGHVLATLDRKPDTNEVDNFAEWLATVTNGDKILAQLRKASPKMVKQVGAEA